MEIDGAVQELECARKGAGQCFAVDFERVASLLAQERAVDRRQARGTIRPVLHVSGCEEPRLFAAERSVRASVAGKEGVVQNGGSSIVAVHQCRRLERIGAHGAAPSSPSSVSGHNLGGTDGALHRVSRAMARYIADDVLRAGRAPGMAGRILVREGHYRPMPKRLCWLAYGYYSAHRERRYPSQVGAVRSRTTDKMVDWARESSGRRLSLNGAVPGTMCEYGNRGCMCPCSLPGSASG